MRLANKNKWPFIALFLLLFVSYSYVNAGWGYNQYSRLDLLHSLVIDGTFNIDAHHGNTGDASFFNGHYYSDKAPGIAFLALPAFLVSTAVLKVAGIPLESDRAWGISHWITSAGSVGLLTALGGVAMLSLLSQFIGRRYALIATLATFLGSLPFPYATMLFSHGAVIGLLSIALWAVYRSECQCLSQWNISYFFQIWNPLLLVCLFGCLTVLGVLLLLGGGNAAMLMALFSFMLFLQIFAGLLLQHRRKRHSKNDITCTLTQDLIAGLCCGLAVASEYTALIAALGIFILLLSKGYRRAVFFSVMALFPLLLVPLYSWFCFGSFLTIGYGHVVGWEGMRQGIFGITFIAHPGIARILLFSPERGLFFWTPFFLLSFFGIRSFFKKQPLFFGVTWAVIILQIFAISGYAYWDGGTAIGPRHLAAMIPFMALAAGFGLSVFPITGTLLALISILLMSFATLINALPSSVSDLIGGYYVPAILKGSTASNIGKVLGLSSTQSILLYAIFIMGMLFAMRGAFRRRIPHANN